MNHTVISKSGWQGDFWRVQKTFVSKSKAESYRKSIHQRVDATQDHYNTAIKAHRKDLSKLIDPNSDGTSVRFADGTLAVWEW